MNLGHISHYFRPLCQGCDRPYYALPFDDILYDVSCTCIVDYLVLILYNFDNKHIFIVIVIVIGTKPLPESTFTSRWLDP